MRLIGEVQSEWAPFRRKYHLHVFQPSSTIKAATSETGSCSSVALESSNSAQRQNIQFAHIDEPVLSWDFSLRSEFGRILGSVNRNFAGFAREIFTDTGVYALRMNATGSENETTESQPASHGTRDSEFEASLSFDGKKIGPEMTYDQRAVMLATAVTVDYDYFSRHSHGSGMGIMPLWIGGGEAAEGGAAAAGAGEVASEGARRAVGGTTAGISSVGEGAVAGAGTMAGYEAVQRGSGGEGVSGSQNSPPDEPSRYSPEETSQHPPGHGEEDVWGAAKDPWTSESQPPAGGSGGDDGGGGGSSFWDIFSGD